MKVLILCDDLWHPAEVIQRGIAGLDSEKYQFDFVMAAKDILTPELMLEYPVVLCAKGNAVTGANPAPWFEDTVTEVGPAELRAYVEAGGGFIALHAANTFHWDKDREFCEFVGNSFVGHPLRCPVTCRMVKKNEITEGVEDFTRRDEHYELDHLAEDIDVFMESISETGGTQISGYTRRLGMGRLCVLTPGHTLAVWQDGNFRRLLENAIDWAGGKE